MSVTLEEAMYGCVLGGGGGGAEDLHISKNICIYYANIIMYKYYCIALIKEERSSLAFNHLFNSQSGKMIQ